MTPITVTSGRRAVTHLFRDTGEWSRCGRASLIDATTRRPTHECHSCVALTAKDAK